MNPEVRFSLRFVRLMIEEGLVPELLTNPQRPYMEIYQGLHPKGGCYLEICEKGVLTIWRKADLSGCVMTTRYDIEWPETAHARLAALALIDRALATRQWPVQPAAEQKGPSA